MAAIDVAEVSARVSLASSCSSSRLRFLAPPPVGAGTATKLNSPNVAFAVEPGSSAMRRRISARIAAFAKYFSLFESATFGKGERKVKSGFIFVGITIGSESFGEDEAYAGYGRAGGSGKVPGMENESDVMVFIERILGFRDG